jgi:hypothetical protein
LTKAPASRPSQSRRAKLRLKATSRTRITRRQLDHGLAVRLTPTTRVRVVMTLNGPGSIHTQRRLTLAAGSRKLTIRPRTIRGARAGRKLTLVVTATAPDGRRTTVRRTIHIVRATR